MRQRAQCGCFRTIVARPDDEVLVSPALEAGADGYLLKQFEFDRFAPSIQFDLMKKSIVPAIIGAALVLFSVRVSAQSTTVYATAMTNGTINPMLFGNMIELIDDICPGLWAEMLNDRCFEGILPMNNGIYYNGAHDFSRSRLGYEQHLEF